MRVDPLCLYRKVKLRRRESRMAEYTKGKKFEVVIPDDPKRDVIVDCERYVYDIVLGKYRSPGGSLWPWDDLMVQHRDVHLYVREWKVGDRVETESDLDDLALIDYTIVQQPGLWGVYIVILGEWHYLGRDGASKERPWNLDLVNTTVLRVGGAE